MRRYFYVTRPDHPNDAVYAANVIEYLTKRGVATRELVMNRNPADRSELAQCLSGDALAVLGTIWNLDHSCIGSQTFLDAAATAQVPVIQWLLDHPSAVWPRFEHSTADNSAYLFLSAFSESYFRRFILPECHSAWTVGTGTNRHSREEQLGRLSYLKRDIACILPLNLRRVGGTLEDAERRLLSLEPDIQSGIVQAIASAQQDLDHPVEWHLDGAFLPKLLDTPSLLHYAVQIIEEIVQVRRRLRVFRTACEFPVLIQSDIASNYLQELGRATLTENVSMTETFRRMRRARAVLSLTHINDEIHNRTLNGLNAGTVNIIEDTPGHRRFFTHGENALLFRYGDDSLRECLDLVCSSPEKAYDIAEAGVALRDDPRLRFGGFDNLIKLSNPADRSAQRRRAHPVANEHNQTI